MNDRTTVVTPDEEAELPERVDGGSAPVDDDASVPAVSDSALDENRGPAESSTDGNEAQDRSDETAGTGAKSRFRWRNLIPRPVTAVLVVLLVAAVVCAAVFGWKLKVRNDDEAAGQAAMAAAKDYAVALTSIDSAHIDADFATVLNGATGQFEDMYSQSATQLKPLLLQAKSVSKGHVVAASVQSVSGDHAVVMLFVDAQITNVTNPDPRVDRNRILMTMDRVGGRWLASKVDLP